MSRVLGRPRATFRAVSGLIVAVFMVSKFAAADTTAADGSAQAEGPDWLPESNMVARLATRPAEAERP